MRIAFVSYEYPPDTADGGIGTYTEQAAWMLRDRGHDIEVFAASREKSGTRLQEKIPVHRVQVAAKPDFAEAIAPLFLQRHNAVGFQVIEGPDFNADARSAAHSAPDAALVVRLHTPRYLTVALNSFGHPEADGNPRPDYRPLDDYEYRHAIHADLVTAPSAAIRERVCRNWGIDEEAVEVIPNVYRPAPELLETDVNSETGVVTFVGRLERRKGVLQLGAAIPDVLRRCPQVRFRFVGRPLPSPEEGLDMREYLQRQLVDWRENVAFPGPRPLAQIPSVLADTDIAVFPSLWENFPCVCLEAMAAGRGVVGSRNGGMAEMLSDGAGILVDPYSVPEIADAIIRLLTDPEERRELGKRARERVLARYAPAGLAARQEALYEEAIRRKRAGGGPAR